MDYQPLTREEIADLLHEASQHVGDTDPKAVSHIQNRLIAGIRGSQNPRLIAGPVADAQLRIEDLFMKRYHEGASPDLVEKLYTLMQV